MKIENIKTNALNRKTCTFVDLEIGEIFILLSDVSCSDIDFKHLRTKVSDHICRWVLPINADRASDLDTMSMNDKVSRIASIEIKVMYLYGE